MEGRGNALALGAAAVVSLACLGAAGGGGAAQPECDPDDGGLELPDGFCALVVADGVGEARHLVVAEDGDIYVALRGRRGGGGVTALRDTTADGRADVRERLGTSGGTGIGLRDGGLWFGADDRILRWELSPGGPAPDGEPATVVSGLPSERSHEAKPLAFGPDGSLFVSIGSPSNACQVTDREPGSPGKDPCEELATRAGIWRFDAWRTGQTQAEGERFATGLRNTVALAVNPGDGRLYGAVHGRDQLDLWPGFTAEENAEKPAEKLVRIERGDDFGWPYCYYDSALERYVQSPEYGGDGRLEGRCAGVEEPLLTFPAHWAPLSLLFYAGSSFPERYRGGAFVAFHGSWNRAPLPQQGYLVAFVPFGENGPAGSYEVFAEGFAGAEKDPRTAEHRPAGLAQGPDGSLYVSDDAGGRIWRIIHRP